MCLGSGRDRFGNLSRHLFYFPNDTLSFRRSERDDGPNELKKRGHAQSRVSGAVDHIKPKTSYRVEFETDKLVIRAVDAIKRM